MPQLKRFALPVVMVLSVGCGGTTEVINPPPPQAIGLTLNFIPDPEDLATAQALGWQAGIPGVTASLTPTDSSAAPRAVTSAADGSVFVADLPAGDYIVEASRWLTPVESGVLAAADDGNGFAARTVVRATGSAGSVIVPVPASRRRGLVISEWAFNGHGYDFGGFLELFNNADTTIYLDGLVVGEGWWASLETPITPCAVTLPFRNDPAGIWGRFFARFPGLGRDHAVAPGKSVVIATDAIDHRPFEPTALDLSHADFEFAGTEDVDNPSVPNMIDIGLISYSHGLKFFGLVNVPFLAKAFDPGQLPRAVGPGGTSQWVRVPADRILDAAAIGTNYPPPAGLADCPPLVNGRFDRQESRARGTDEVAEYTRSLSRRTAPSAASGRPILQWTRSGYADFVRSVRTPGLP